MIRIIILFIITICHSVYTHSQTVCPVSPDFTELTGTWVTAMYGGSRDPFANKGIVNGRHTLISTPGTDHYTNGNLSLLPDHTSRVIRLGEARSNQSESLSYRFIVDSENPLLHVKFAAVFNEYTGATPEKKSHFMVRVLDTSGQPIHSCATFDLKVGYNDYIQYKRNGKFPPDWFDWQSLIIDMTSCKGQEVEVQFIKSAGISYGGNDWAYSYFTAGCISAKMQMRECEGRRFTLTAPNGYYKYNWFNRIETQEQHFEMGDSDMSLSCTTTSANGCRTNLSAAISDKGAIPPTDRIIYDTIRQGDSYIKNNFNLPVFKNPGDYVHHHTFCDRNTCSSKTIYSLFLKVHQRYYPLEAQICEGEDYTANGFKRIKPTAGIYFDTLRLISARGQDSIVCLKLSVSASSISPDRINGNTSPCTGTKEIYDIPFAGYESGNTWQWELPAGITKISNPKDRRLEVEFTDQAQPGNFTLHYATGCTSGSVSLWVEPHPSYRAFFTDSICTGQEYHAHGFHLPRQETAETRLHYQFHTTASGCDSILALALTVNPTPEIKLVRSDSVICNGTEVQLHVQAVNHSEEEDPGPFIAPGDVYCSDGSVIRPSAYPGSGKTAEGVVFWVDASGHHGWVVHKEVQCKDCPFVTGEGIELPEGLGVDLEDQLVTDTTGYNNTRLFWESGRINDYPAMKSVEFAKGWYIPASKQLLILMGNMFSVKETLIMIGGEKLLSVNTDTNYWSSTQSEEDKYMYIWEQYFNISFKEYHSMSFNGITLQSGVRSIRNF